MHWSLLVAIVVVFVGCGDAPTPRPGESLEVLAKAESMDCSSFKKVSIPASADTFAVMTYPVTVAQYETFTQLSGYTTQAERFGNSGVFDYKDKIWRLIDSADFRNPLGPAAGASPANHPATQVSYYDAAAFCAYYHMRLPTAQEWETAARYRQPEGARYPWGDSIRTVGEGFRANVWQGIFPHVRQVEDGYAYSSPVDAYPPAPSGLYDMAGNVWEWVSDTVAGARVDGDDVHRLAKGGSFLCEPLWCHGYLITGSTHNSSETGLFHTGFRCVCDE